MNRSKFPQKTINAIKRMYAVKKQKRYTLAGIAEKLGVSITMVRYHGDPETKLRYYKHGEKWRKANPEAWKKISRRAVRKYYEAHRIDSSSSRRKLTICHAAVAEMKTLRMQKSARSVISRSHALARSK